MSKITDTINQVVHDATNLIIDSQVTEKASSAVSTLVTTAFDVVDQLLGAVSDFTAPEDDS